MTPVVCCVCGRCCLRFGDMVNYNIPDVCYFLFCLFVVNLFVVAYVMHSAVWSGKQCRVED